MRLAILADTHMPKGDRGLPEACLAELDRAQLIVHLGDFTAASVLAELEAIGPPLVAVHGNVDDRELRDRLPTELEFEAEAATIALVHDAGPREGRLGRLRRRFPDADVVLFGHSHMPQHERDRIGGFQIFNPGSPTERRRAPKRTMGLADIEGGEVRLRHLEL